MHLVELFLPIQNSDGAPISQEEFARLRSLLVETHGGMTEFSRTPARGLWKASPSEATEVDNIVVFEVMVEKLDRSWWGLVREELEKRFGQELIVIRAHEIEQL